MRVISQDGTMDVPYEMVVIQRFRNAIYFLNRNLTGVEGLINDIALAEYSTKEKAIKALKMLSEVYTFYNDTDHTIFKFPQDNEIEV